MPLIIDTHLDLAWNALSWKRDLSRPLDELNAAERSFTDSIARGRATVSLPEMRRGGVAVCLGTLMARVPHGQTSQSHGAMLDYPSQDIAFAVAQGQLAYYRRLAELGEIALIANRGQLAAHWQRWNVASESERLGLPIGLILAMEGCDAIVDDDQVGRWFTDGLRCPSLVHYGQSAYASGTGATGPLTPRGREILPAFSRAGMILDVTHLCDQSFFETLELFEGPVFASHQNCRQIVPGERQFSDEQIRLVISREGVLGTAFDSWMLYAGWRRGATLDATTSREVVGIAAAADHIDHVCQLAGNRDHAALGSDLDGGYGTEQTPRDLNSIADLQRLAEILSQRGYRDVDVDAVFHGNWLRFFLSHLPE